VWVLDQFVSTTGWPRIDHGQRGIGTVKRWRALNEATNYYKGGCDWDPEGEKYREDDMKAVSNDSIVINKGIKRYSKHMDGKLVRVRDHFQNTLNRNLALYRDGPIYVQIDNGDIGLLDLKIGTGFLFTSLMGPGASGFVDHPLIIIRRTFHVDTHTVSLLCLDLEAIIASNANQQFLVTDNTTLAPLVTDDPALAPLVA
jgi:hypothetical protein